jgi:gluconate 2-dehydrogenase gamma chain
MNLKSGDEKLRLPPCARAPGIRDDTIPSCIGCHRKPVLASIHDDRSGCAAAVRLTCMRNPMDQLSRRSFFKTAATAAAALAAPAPLLGAPAQAAPPAPRTPATPPYLFFRPDEAAIIEAASERLIPLDANGPGATQAGVTAYIDRQLAGAWGAGERLYRSGPWQPGQPSQGNGLRGLAALVRQRHAKTFAQLSAQQQDAMLEALQTGKEDLDGVPAPVFFESLLAMTVEGYFSDPAYGGNRDMAAWKMIGFPGAYASFYDLVDQHGVAYTREPMSMGDNGRGVIELHPVHGPAAHGTPQPAGGKGRS